MNAPADRWTESTNVESDRIEGRVLEAKGTDTAGGRIFGVQIIAYGDSKNARRYPEATMRAAAPMYEGAKAYDHHRTEAELASSTITGLVGTYRNVEADGSGLQADLVLLPSATHAAEALDASLASQAKGGAPLVGISHDVMARYQPVQDGNRRLMEATQIVSVNSADVVADPAAGGKATRFVAGGTGDIDDPEKGDPTMTLKELLALLRGATPEKRAELLAAHKAELDEYGLDEAAVDRILTDTAPPAVADPPAPAVADEVKEPVASSVESKYDRAGHLGRLLISAALQGAGIDAKLTESVTKMLPEHFTEAQLTAQIEGLATMTRALEAAGLAPKVAADVKVTADALDKKIERLDATFAGDYVKGYRSFKEAFVDITGIAPKWTLDTEDFNRMVLRESIGSASYDSALRSTESVSSGTWSTILGDSVTRRMVAEYQQPSLQTWRAVVSSIVPVNDFRTQRIERMGGYGVLPAVAQGAPYNPLTSPTNEEATYAITKRGGTEDLTIETIANDDLRAVQRIPVKLGLAAAQTLYRFVWDTIQANGNIYDSTALFVAGHNNTATAVLSSTALEATRVKLRKQAAYGDTSDILSLKPRYLIVPPDLEPLAFQLCTSAVAIPSGAPVGAAANQPNLHVGMDYIVVDYWSALSATQWYVTADPNLVPTIELGFYQGQQDPMLFVQNDPSVGSVFTSDKITWKVRHIYSGAVLDFRGFQRGNT